MHAFRLLSYLCGYGFFPRRDNVRVKLEYFSSSDRPEETYIATETDAFNLDIKESHRPFLDITSGDHFYFHNQS